MLSLPKSGFWTCCLRGCKCSDNGVNRWRSGAVEGTAGSQIIAINSSKENQQCPSTWWTGSIRDSFKDWVSVQPCGSVQTRLIGGLHYNCISCTACTAGRGRKISTTYIVWILCAVCYCQDCNGCQFIYAMIIIEKQSLYQQGFMELANLVKIFSMLKLPTAHCIIKMSLLSICFRLIPRKASSQSWATTERQDYWSTWYTVICACVYVIDKLWLPRIYRSYTTQAQGRSPRAWVVYEWCILGNHSLSVQYPDQPGFYICLQSLELNCLSDCCYNQWWLLSVLILFVTVCQNGLCAVKKTGHERM